MMVRTKGKGERRRRMRSRAMVSRATVRVANASEFPGGYSRDEALRSLSGDSVGYRCSVLRFWKGKGFF